MGGLHGQALACRVIGVVVAVVVSGIMGVDITIAPGRGVAAGRVLEGSTWTAAGRGGLCAACNEGQKR